MFKRLSLVLAFVLCLSLTACGGRVSADEDTLFVDKKGNITVVYVSAFDKEYYDKDELLSFVNETVSEYVSENGAGSVTVDGAEVEDGMARVTLKYAVPNDYAKFNEVELFSGKVLDALTEGYDIPSDIVKVNAKAKDATDASYKALIIGQQIDVKVKGTVMYASSNVTMVGDTAKVEYDEYANNPELAYIIYK